MAEEAMISGEIESPISLLIYQPLVAIKWLSMEAIALAKASIASTLIAISNYP